MSAVLMAASITLAGCGITPVPSPAAVTPTATPTTSAGYFEDTVANYAITFPGEPSVVGTDSGAVRLEYSTSPDPMAPGAVVYTTRGTTVSEQEIVPETLESMMFQLINRAGPLTDPHESFELEGMPALKIYFTGPNDSPTTMVVAGEGYSLYQLIVIGGTPEESQKFFDSFKLLS